MIAIFLGVLVFMFFGIVLGAVFSLIPFLLAWNYVSPLFGLPYLDWLQALAILVVAYSIGAGFKTSVTK